MSLPGAIFVSSPSPATSAGGQDTHLPLYILGLAQRRQNVGPAKGCLTILLASFFLFSLLPSPGTLFFFFFPLFLRDLEILLLAGTQFFKKMLWLGQLSCNQREEEELMPLSGDHFGQGGKFRGRERSVGPMGIYWLNVVVARCSEVRLRKFPSSEPPALLFQV